MQRDSGQNRKDTGHWDRSQVKAIVADGDYETLVSVAESVGRALVAHRLSTSQIRNVFGEVRRLQQAYDRNRLIMLKPRLMYIGKRAGAGGTVLRDVLTAAIDEVRSGGPPGEAERQRFDRMADFFEAILAYHRAFGGE
jgi:CRISPR-associated protein Csm2